ncbi:hypothetical protein RJ640_000928, partial [Escallonia rubra]
YNESDQPVCRVCNVVLKSEAAWPAHQLSRQHHEAIKNVKASAAGVSRINSGKQESAAILPKPKAENSLGSRSKRPEPSAGLPKPQPSSVLPSNFFDNHETKRQKNGKAKYRVDIVKSGDPNSDDKIGGLSVSNTSQRNTNEVQPPKENALSESKQVKGALPEGFFDDKNADLRARGITPVKLDVKDEYKEFEKLIQEDLKEVDNRMEEEEFDAAEMIEGAESVEQRTYKGRVEMLKRKKLELKAARSSNPSKGALEVGKESSHEESSSGDDSDEDFAVDWRAKHM